jgi:hypothetical protein
MYMAHLHVVHLHHVAEHPLRYLPAHPLLCGLLTSAASCCAVPCCVFVAALAANHCVARDRNTIELRYNRDAQVAADLRCTLWNWKLGNVLVFETERHMQNFRDIAGRMNKTLNGWVTGLTATLPG